MIFIILLEFHSINIYLYSVSPGTSFNVNSNHSLTYKCKVFWLFYPHPLKFQRQLYIFRLKSFYYVLKDTLAALNNKAVRFTQFDWTFNLIVHIFSINYSHPLLSILTKTYYFRAYWAISVKFTCSYWIVQLLFSSYSHYLDFLCIYYISFL